MEQRLPSTFDECQHFKVTLNININLSLNEIVAPEDYARLKGFKCWEVGGAWLAPG